MNKKDATVTVIKDAQPNAAQDFAFTTTGAGLSGFSLDDDANATLSNTKVFTISGADFGAKTITEGDAAGWALTALTCNDDDFVKTGKTAELDVEPGEQITCTFINQKAATLTIVKDAAAERRAGLRVHDDRHGPEQLLARRRRGRDAPQERTFVIVGGEFGSKTVTESAVAGWSLTDITCSEGSDTGATATVQVDPGDEITCTFTNKKDATVTVVKNAIPNDPENFSFTTSGLGAGSRSRRRRRRHAVQHQDDHGVGLGLRFEVGDRGGRAGLGPDGVRVLGG